LNGEAKDVSSGADRMFFLNGQVENNSNNFVNYGENTGIYEEIVGTVAAVFSDQNNFSNCWRTVLLPQGAFQSDFVDVGGGK
jgi:hypothetical protein